MKKLTILIVGAFPKPSNRVIFGGVVSSCRALVSSTLVENFNLLLLDSTQKSNPAPSLIIRLPFAFKRLLVYCGKLWNERPDIVLIFTSSGFSLLEKGLMGRIALFLQKSTLIFPRSGVIIEQFSNSSFQRCLIRWALGNSTKLLCQGDAWHNFAVRELKYPQENAPVIHNWTATKELLAIGQSKIELDINDPVKLLFLGWLEEKKGIFELLESCLQLNEKTRFSLVVAGKGNAEERAMEFVKDNGLVEKVDFRGWVEGNKLEKLFMECDVLVLPSWAEGLPNAMIEAMAAGLAVVVSAVGNVPSVMTDGKNGLLIPPRDVDALTKALFSLIEDPVFLKKLAMSGHTMARDNFSISRAVGKLEKIFNEIKIGIN
ncbi:glycosyltransferase family 4 protein [Opitutales bacterium]|nr:glycosyltransferase family 4 protein [Opitutales bacterium]